MGFYRNFREFLGFPAPHQIQQFPMNFLFSIFIFSQEIDGCCDSIKQWILWEKSSNMWPLMVHRHYWIGFLKMLEGFFVRKWRGNLENALGSFLEEALHLSGMRGWRDGGIRCWTEKRRRRYRIEKINWWKTLRFKHDKILTLHLSPYIFLGANLEFIKDWWREMTWIAIFSPEKISCTKHTFFLGWNPPWVVTVG